MDGDFPTDFKSAFVADLVACNRLDDMGFSRFLFFPGMLFGSCEKWWGSGGARPSAHEGLDLCFFTGHGDRRYRLDETVSVPMAFDGKIVRIMDDFLGRTVVARSQHPSAMTYFYAFYAHIRPDKALREGDTLSAGTVFAAIAPVLSPTAMLPPHLHITLADACRLPPVDALSWPVMNRLSRSVFFNPLDLLPCEYAVLGYASFAAGEDPFKAVGSVRDPVTTQY